MSIMWLKILKRNKWINDYIRDEEDFKLVQKLKTSDVNNLHFIRGDILYCTRYIGKTRFLTPTKSINVSNVKSSITVRKIV